MSSAETMRSGFPKGVVVVSHGGVIGQLLHNEFGVPDRPSLTTIPAKLLEGPTLRPAVGAEVAGSS